MNKKAFFSSLFALAYMSLIFLSFSYSSNQTTSITDITDVKREFFLARMFLDRYISDLLLKDYVNYCGVLISPYYLNLNGFHNFYYPNCTLQKQAESLVQINQNTYSYNLTALVTCTNKYATYGSQLNFSKTITILPYSTPPPVLTFLITDGFTGVLEASASAC